LLLIKMTDTDAFESPKALLQEAGERFSHLEQLCDRFKYDHPLQKIYEDDPETGLVSVKLRVEHPVSSSIRAKVSGIINDLWHSLDQAVWQGISLTPNSTPDSKTIYFPFCEGPNDLNGRLQKLRSVGMSWSVAEAIRAYKPYPENAQFPDGNMTLRCIGYFASTKHKQIVGLNIDSNEIHVKKLYMEEGGSAIGSWDRKNQEIELCKVPQNSHIEYSVEIPYFICFTQIRGLDGKPVIPFMRAAFEETDAIISDIESATFDSLR